MNKPIIIRVTGINLGPNLKIKPRDAPANNKNAIPSKIPPGIKGHFPILCRPNKYMDKKAAPRLPNHATGIIIPRIKPLVTKKINIPNHIKIEPGIKKPILYLE